MSIAFHSKTDRHSPAGSSGRSLAKVDIAAERLYLVILTTTLIKAGGHCFAEQQFKTVCHSLQCNVNRTYYDSVSVLHFCPVNASLRADAGVIIKRFLICFCHQSRQSHRRKMRQQAILTYAICLGDAA
jgi:hypothetical protein